MLVDVSGYDPTPNPPALITRVASAYEQAQVQLTQAVWDAKEYIEAYAPQVTDWSELTLMLHNGGHQESNPNTLKKGEYVSLANKNNRDEFDARVFKTRRRNNGGLGPVETITDIVFDRTDGDFSLTINGRQWWWIQHQAVIVLADYIYHQLNPATPGYVLP